MRKKSLLVQVCLVFTILLLAVACEEPLEQRDCVVMLGDSIFALSDEETEFLEGLSGQAYRQYYITGAQMEGGFVATIPTQYNRAKNQDSNIRTVIFDGGGNDILIGGQSQCSTAYGSELSASCRRIVNTLEEVTTDLIRQMVNDGVKNIVMQGYYWSTDRDLWQVSEVSNANTIDYIAALDAEYPDVNITFINMMDHFDKNNAESYTVSDGIHPTTATSEKLANILWETMAANGVETADEPCGTAPNPGCD